MPMQLDTGAIKAESRSLLRTGSVNPFRMTLFYLLITLVLDMINSGVSYMIDSAGGFTVLSFSFVSILVGLVALVLNAGYYCYCFGILRREEMPYESLFDAFPFAGKVILLSIVEGVFIFLWSMLFVIPGIIAAYRTENTPEAASALDNIEELLNSMQEFKERCDAEIRNGERPQDEEATIEEWLQNVMLVTDMDKDDPEDRNKVTLMTVHSAKGLEYDRVILLDVLDGILPAADPKEPEDQKLYQEERRIFYVAMTRAKDHLFLFSCLDRESSFIRELQKDLPVETSEADDVFGSVEIDPCGKPYHHARKGRGTVLACCQGRCLVEYSGGEMQLLTVGEMYDQRRLLQRLPEKPAVRKEEVLAAGAIAGRSVVHTVFGPGRITAYKDPVVTIRFPKSGEKHFILSESIKRGLLRYEDGGTG